MINYEKSIVGVMIGWLLIGCTTSSPDTMQKEEKLYRPHFHFTPQTQWLNDPNGMFYFEGTYHLYFQYHPFSNVWGPMHWGHATSKDLLHWKEHPIALFPDALGSIFSGSIVVDHQNTSGFGKEGQIPIVAIYTNHDQKGEDACSNTFQTQSIAYSLDQGFNWVKYDQNPVIPNPGITDFRDPKVFWDLTSRQWIMTLAVNSEVFFYHSSDLKQWSYLSRFGKGIGNHEGVWECPELMELPVAGTKEKKWVLLVSINPGGPNGGSATQYFIGYWNGKEFIPDSEFVNSMAQKHDFWLDFGTDNYASVSFNNLPHPRGKKVIIGWQSNWEYARKVPTQKWKNGMTLPREIDLLPAGTTYRMRSLPTPFWKTHLVDKKITESLAVDSKTILASIEDLALDRMQISGEITLSEDQSFVFQMDNSQGDKLIFGYQGKKKEFFIDRSQLQIPNFNAAFSAGKQTAARNAVTSTIPFQIIIDKTSLELFFDGGLTVLTALFFPSAPLEHLRMLANQNSGKIEYFKLSEFIH